MGERKCSTMPGNVQVRNRKCSGGGTEMFWQGTGNILVGDRGNVLVGERQCSST